MKTTGIGTGAAALLLLNACASTQSLEPRLDEMTGVTWTTLSEPVAMAHATPQLSTAARDYLYVGPIEMNERGTREEFLWFGLATTVPGTLSEDIASMPRSLILEVDGLAFELPVSEWEEPVPYETPATVTHSVTARVSLDQIGLIAGASHVSIELHNADGSSAAYEHWNGEWIDWVAFRDAMDPDAALTRSVARN
jgi:hypothetical protein